MYFREWLLIKFFTVLDSWEGNMLPLGRTQAANVPGNLVYNEGQLMDMLLIADQLDNLGVVHGDLKPDQFLYRGDRKEMCVTDFGLAFTFGWTEDVEDPEGMFNCPNIRVAGERISSAAARYINRWQLDNFLRVWHTYIVDNERSVRLFAGLIFPLTMIKTCPRAHVTYEKWKEEEKEILEKYSPEDVYFSPTRPYSKPKGADKKRTEFLDAVKEQGKIAKRRKLLALEAEKSGVAPNYNVYDGDEFLGKDER